MVAKIAGIEEAIVEALKMELTIAHVEAFPDQPRDYNLMHNKGAVLVAYKGREKELVSDCGLGCSNYEFVVSFLFRNLRVREGHAGIYEALELAEDALNGIAELQNERFVNFDNGVWEYSQLYMVNKIG
ncbi:Gp37 family protein [Candidatus Thiothrix sp. Deng01]|uniref:Gp37 family protein n=1 Tax=Candidatus Thiothrix phosphatis TaxID=3112415 RepID=A0ABU6CT84_9GAMM|nr:Gp37 family protein [Candidatus Thiothrix sp. Deng01]MEB4590025.1 Gp37 family protein [Candidatus Thiothrix sp. Deng01]